MCVAVVCNPQAGHDIENLVIRRRPIDQAPLHDGGARNRPTRGRADRLAGFNVPGVEGVRSIAPLGNLPVEMAHGESGVDDELPSLGRRGARFEGTLEGQETTGRVRGGYVIQAAASSQKEAVARGLSGMVPGQLLNPAANQGPSQTRPLSNCEDLHRPSDGGGLDPLIEPGPARRADVFPRASGVQRKGGLRRLRALWRGSEQNEWNEERSRRM